MTITLITTKQDMSHWVRAHEDEPGINWSVEPGPGGTMLITEREADHSLPAGARGMCPVDYRSYQMETPEADG